MVLDVSFEQIVKEFGHDGSEIYWPTAEEPFCRRGFGHNEIQEIAWRYGYACIWVMPVMPGITIGLEESVEIYAADDIDTYTRNWLKRGKGILGGCFALDRPHAVAWDGISKIYDPKGHILELDEAGFTIRELFIFVQIKSNQ